MEPFIIHIKKTLNVIENSLYKISARGDFSPRALISSLPVGEPAMNASDSRAALSASGRNPLNRTMTDVSGREDTRDGSFKGEQIAVDPAEIHIGTDEVILVLGEFRRQPGDLRFGADKNEQVVSSEL